MRRLWLVAAVQAIVGHPVVLVGGAAVDLHTGGYNPTDIDLVGAVTSDDRQALEDAGFDRIGSRYFRWGFPDGSHELVEFPDSVLDGELVQLELDGGVAVNVISLESLVVDRLLQATDRSMVTFEEAVRLVAAVVGEVDWRWVADDIRARPLRQPIERFARKAILEVGANEIADAWFPSG